MKPASPYYTALEASEYLKFPTVAAFYEFRRRHGVPKATRRGGTLLFTLTSLESALDHEKPAKLRKVS